MSNLSQYLLIPPLYIFHCTGYFHPNKTNFFSFLSFLNHGEIKSKTLVTTTFEAYTSNIKTEGSHAADTTFLKYNNISINEFPG